MRNGLIRPVETAIGTPAKRAMLASLRARKAEGIVFKRADAVYAPGRPASGGSQRKFKFTASASCIVAGRNTSRRSVALELRDGKNTVAVGNVTIPPNQAIPEKGDIVEIRFLYAYPGGSLYQPVYLGKRDDVNADQCGVGQLKYRAGEGTEEG